MYASAAATISWFYDPSVSFGLLLFQLLEMSVELVELLGQYVSIRYKVVLFASKLLLRLHKVCAKPVFPRYFITHRKMIDALKLIQSFVEERFAT